jgi:hypothetical protein
MTATRKEELRAAVAGGVIAGLVGGLVLSLFMVAMSVAQGADIWMGAKVAGAPVMGERMMQPGFDLPAVLVGVISHLGVSIAWGVLFGILFFGLSDAETMAGGVAWGVVVWLAMFYVILPLLGLSQIAASVTVARAIFEHLLFGVSVAMAFLPFQPSARLSPAIEKRRMREEQRPTGTF